MDIQIKIISKETIKPSSPTPKPLQKYPLSYLDQIAPPVFMPLVYFYQSHNTNSKPISNTEKSNHLKKTLSEALPIFYPLAGRLSPGALHVDCNDEGGPFFEAEADCTLSEIITNPDPKLMHIFLPYKLDDVQTLGVAAQVTFFKCGGHAVGLVMSHKIADALSFFLFANTWAAFARGGPPPLRPKFESAAIFPPRNISGYMESTGMVKPENLDVKIFEFPAEKISLLREMYSSTGRPTRVEALSAFIWKRFVSAVGTTSDPNKIHIVLHAINLRTRIDPPLTEDHFGNISRIAIAVPSAGDGEVELLQKVREAIRAVDGDYVAKLKENDDHLSYIKELVVHNNKGALVPFNFTSLCRFPVYEADFGWGKPVWVGSAGLTFENLVTFMDRAGGDGIEAWVILKKGDMEKFEADLELQKFLA